MNIGEMKLADIYELIVNYGIKVLIAILILVIGIWIAKLVTKSIQKLMTKKEVDPTLNKFAAGIIKTILYAFVIIAAIDQAGLETTSLVAILGAAGLAVGFALQGSLSNFAASVMLIIFKPIKVGDFIDAAGAKGIVEEIGIFVTTLLTLDNKMVFIPNSKIASDNIVNYSKKDTRRVDMVFGIGYSDDIDKARKVIESVLKSESKILAEPAAQIVVSELGDSSVNFAVRPWVRSADYWTVYFNLMEQVKKKFDEEKISIPFPQRDVHVYQN